LEATEKRPVARGGQGWKIEEEKSREKLAAFFSWKKKR
jgi:hypothetical protein